MTWQDRGELRADPGIAPGKRNIDPPRRRSIWPSIAVTAAAAAFAGVIWFAYQNGRVGNGSGQPPLVKAETGPTKVKPDNPGGQEIPFQDSTVYDRLNQNGQKPVVEKLLPETETPVARPQPVPANDPTALAPPGGTAPTALPQGNNIVVAPSAPPSDAPAVAAVQPNAPAPLPVAPAPTVAAVPPPVKPVPATATPPKPAQAAKPAADSIAALIGASETKVATPAKTPRPAIAGGGAYRLQLSAVRSPDAAAGNGAD